MPRKRREPSPPPPPPATQGESSSSSSEEDEAEDVPPTPAPQKRPQNPQPSPPDAAAHGGDAEEEEESDSDADAEAFQLRQVTRSPAKPLAPQLQRHALEDGEGSESEEIPEPVQKKATAAASRKSKVEEDRKRSAAPEPAPSSKPNKGKEAEAIAAEASPDLTPSNKAKNRGGKLEKTKVTSSPSSKSEKGKRPPRGWTKDDEIKILEAISAHIKTDGALPRTDTLIALVGNRLDRESCSYSDMYEKVRTLKKRYQKVLDTGVLPTNQDEIQIYNLSEAVWGEKAKEAIAAATSQKDSTVNNSRKGIEKVNGIPKDSTQKNASINAAKQNDGALKAGKRGREEEKTDRNVKGKLVKEATTTAALSKSKKQASHSDELDEAAESGVSKETTTTATENGGALTKIKKGKTDKEKSGRDKVSLMPKEAATATQNGGAPKGKEGENNEEEMETDATAKGERRDFDELQKLYSNLAAYVEGVEAQHPCGQTLKRAFEFIGDEKAHELEYQIKKQRLAEAKVQIRRADITKDVLNLLIGLVD